MTDVTANQIIADYDNYFICFKSKTWYDYINREAWACFSVFFYLNVTSLFFYLNLTRLIKHLAWTWMFWLEPGCFGLNLDVLAYHFWLITFGLSLLAYHFWLIFLYSHLAYLSISIFTFGLSFYIYIWLIFLYLYSHLAYLGSVFFLFFVNIQNTAFTGWH